MDIHAPHEPIRTFKDFAFHILTVTIGILIALSLEGLRESIHNRHLVEDARRNFLRELREDKENMEKEMSGVRKNSNVLKDVIATLPQMTSKPAEINKKLTSTGNPGYFLLIQTWQTSLSTGALSHMSEDEAESYADAEYGIRIYTNLQGQAISAEDKAKVFFAAHPNLSAAELREGTERLLLWERAEDALVFVGAQTQRDIESAFERASHE